MANSKCCCFRKLLTGSLSDAKRLIGRRFDDQSIQTDMKHWPFEVINDSTKPKLRVNFKGDSKIFSPEEISSMVLTKMKETAEAYLGKVIIAFSVQYHNLCFVMT